MSNIGDLVATATLDIAPFMTNTKNLKTYMRGLDNSLKAVEKSITGQGKSFKGLTSLYNQTGQSLTAYQSLLAKQSDKYNQLKTNIGDINNATASQKSALAGARAAMTETAAKVAELQSRYQALAREIAISSSVFTKFGNFATGFGSGLQKLGGIATGVGASLTAGLTAPIVAGAGYAVKAAIDYESAFAGVKKTVDEAVDSNGRVTISYNDLSNGIRDMAKQLPASASEIAHVAEVAGQLGIRTEDVLGFTRTMIDMGESTNLSASDAAAAIAKIANITGMTSSEYQRFGSAVVALGNNFATTESDIVEMTNRIAASGKLAGLTNQEMLALATAMSSVGIEAEAGGTAMTQTLTSIEKAVVEGGADLSKFAEIAHMSSADFAKAWKEKPITALQEFIKGLGDLDSKGESATKVLDELGLSGVRQSNMLKSLGLASKTLGNAINTSNKAWSENTALTNEANKRYETTASKLKMLKNEITDAAIEFGGPLIDAMRSGLEAGKPYIKMLGDLAKQFSSLDKEQQQQIIKWGLVAAAAGPALTIFGKVSGVAGSVIKGLGAASQILGKLSGTLQTMGKASTVVGTLGTTAETATTSVGGLGGSFALLSNPIGLMVAGAVGLAGGMVLLANAQDKARENANKFGTILSGETTQKLNIFSNEVNNAKVAMVNFETGATKSSDNVKKAVSSMLDEIKKGASETNQKLEELAKKYGIDQSVIAKAKEKNNQIVQNAQTMADQINAIYDKHNGNVQKFTTAEKTIVESNMRELVASRVSLLGLSKEKERAILKTFNGDVGNMTRAQLKEQASVLKSAMSEEQKLYKSQKADLKKLLDNDLITQEMYNSKMSALKTQHNATMQKLGEALVKVSQEQMSKSGGLVKYTEEARKVLAQYGMSFEDLAKKAARSTNALSNSASMVGTYTAKMSADARKATDQWNALVLDPKTGEVKTNAPEEVAKALLAENGWANMEFVLKNANIQSNARAQIADALIAQRKWDSTTPQQKELIFQNANGLQAIYESKSQLEIWNAMPEKVKNLLANDTDFSTKASVAQATLEKWNGLTPAQKELIATNNTAEGVNAALSLMLTVPETKNTNINATDNTAPAAASAQGAISSVRQYGVPNIFANNATGSATSQAQAGINSVKQPFPAPIFANDITGAPVGSAKRSISSVQGKTVTISAIDRASGVLSGIAGWLGSLRDKVVNVITRHTSNEKGTNFHPGGLAMVNDQKGSLYRELVTLPNGVSFIPDGRNVMLPLPRGSKVLRASLTKQMFPHYADGVGFNETNISSIAKRIGDVKETKSLVINNDNSDIRAMLSQLIKIMSQQGTNSSLTSALETIKVLSSRPATFLIEANEKVLAEFLAKPITEEQEKRQAILNAVNGLGW
ncbi:phage tail protein [Streptococcus pseudoporcinus]|uniref:Phage tail protein n=1 Tax=Streptococcus pseudoporcinus TaxID=361101 RepID=A0A4U9XMC3_9STRE|nr:phage tail tape measure protein [Streptococcus pseudoporcinus]VTS13511.1 phage tail protein [Streptococcus pseudoporcinus]VTS20144.1 phage tail protein [Streptococcus pseudoporcinus]